MPEFSVIVPTYNERSNLEPLTQALAHALEGIDYEVVIVDDDSRDGTAAVARTIAQRDARVRVVHRIGRRGLASAVVEGLLATSSPYMAVMDGDMQHDERILPVMLAKLKAENLDVVIGSRHTGDGSMGEFAADRVALSNMGRLLFETVSSVQVSDPMSGYFVVTREYFHEVVHSLSSVGFKILVDLLASAKRPVRTGEVGYTFRTRAHGESKLDVLVGLEYLQLLLDKWTRGWIPTSYLLFAGVGSAGVLFNFAAAAILLHTTNLGFTQAQAVGALMTIAFNFLLNNALTFRSGRLKGVNILYGLVVFYAVCSVGLLAQLAVAGSLQQFGMHWAPSTLAGIVIGSVWNYSMAALLVWQIRRRRSPKQQRAYDPEG